MCTYSKYQITQILPQAKQNTNTTKQVNCRILLTKDWICLGKNILPSFTEQEVPLWPSYLFTCHYLMKGLNTAEEENVIKHLHLEINHSRVSTSLSHFTGTGFTHNFSGMYLLHRRRRYSCMCVTALKVRTKDLHKMQQQIQFRNWFYSAANKWTRYLYNI